MMSYHIRAILLCLFTLASLSSCTDDLGVSSEANNNDDTNFTGITLLIPDIEYAAEYGATRSDEYINTRAYDQQKEGNFNTLYIAAVDKSDNVFTFLKTTSNGTISSGEDKGYSRYRVNLKEGEYRIYVVANLNRYLSNDGEESTTFANAAVNESAIRNLILNFNSSRPLEPGFLPMACLNEDIRVGENSVNAVKNSDKNAYVNIPAGENVYIYADLKFLCSKVRYTILFDRAKSSFGLNSTDLIDFHRNTASPYPYASRLRKGTALNYSEDAPSVPVEYITDNEGADSEWPLFLDRYIYPDFDFYNLNHTSEEIRNALDLVSSNPWTSTDGEWNTTFKDKRVWQGVAYLPENPVIDGNQKTELNFPYSFNGETGVNSPRGIRLFNDSELLQRAKKYDVYALVTSPDPEQWSFNVVPEDWTLQELAYTLHGPYELVVETSEVPKISMEEEAVFWFRSDVAPSEIGFISPEVSTTGTEGENMAPLFIGGVMKNPDGTYATNENGDYLFRVGLNVDIPYDVIDKLNRSFATGEGGIEYTKSAVQFFHIVAGSLQKRIEIKELDLNPYLKVTPQTIIIDTRELYTSGKDEITYDIIFETNVNPEESSISLTLTDPYALIATGQGEGALKISNPAGYRGSGNIYTLTDKTGKFILNITDIISGNSFWNKSSEYSMTFTLKVSRDGVEDFIVEKEVIIKVRPFSGSYVIHFRDNTKDWEDAHIYVYQDLTLPSDLGSGVGSDGQTRDNSHLAGKIVGFIERNPSSGLQWNAAVQYVFSNNLSFKGWKGYGGPDINNPWDAATWTPNDPADSENSNHSTMGFVMFGNPAGDGSWNYDYSYNVTYGLDPSPVREQRYNYNVNFNGDHEAGFDRWHCGTCKGLSPDYNDWGNDRFYTGITMEKEDDGWWKYTLTGVAQPGRTMIIFANYHKPWDQPEKDYTAEDNRWPGDYESGLPLFDFEDNEGWFLFDGNTTNSNQKFVDEKPVSDVIPHSFTNTYNNRLRIEVKNTSVSSITVNNSSYSRTGTDNGRGVSYFDLDGFSTNNATISVAVNGKSYQLAPKNFKFNGSLNKYVLAKPLYLEYDNSIELFVKWNDHISGQYVNNATYNPGSGTNTLTVWLGENSSDVQEIPFTGKEYGNYKFVRFNTRTPVSNKDKVQFRLTSDGNFYKTLKVEDLPKYFNPTEGYYQINVHKL